MSFYIHWVSGAWSSRGAVYPDHISIGDNPQDSWGIFTAQLKHELDSSFTVHLCKTPTLSSACHGSTPPSNAHTIITATTDFHHASTHTHTHIHTDYGCRSAQLQRETSTSVQRSLMYFYNRNIWRKTRSTTSPCCQYFIQT